MLWSHCPPQAALEALSCNFCIVRMDNNEIDRYDDQCVL
jgi:hypothetical protein